MKRNVSRVFLLCLIFFGFNVNAQQRWSAARLVTVESDTLNGEILFEDWSKSPSSVQFRDANGRVTTKSARDLHGFSIKEPLKKFVSKNLALSYYSKIVVAAGTNPITRTDSVTLFAEVLLQSPSVTLYECIGDDASPRFFLEKNNELHELRNTSYRMASGEHIHNIHKEIYKEQLKQLLWECPSLNTNKVSYSEVDIVGVLLEYHRYCKVDVKSQFEQKDLGGRVMLGGSFRSFFHIDGDPTIASLSMTVLSKKKFNSFFLAVDLGVGFAMDDEQNEYRPDFSFGFYGGKYFGLGKWHPMVYTGYSNLIGILDTGVGLSYKKLVSVSAGSSVHALINGAPNLSFQIKITPISIKGKGSSR